MVVRAVSLGFAGVSEGVRRVLLHGTAEACADRDREHVRLEETI